MTISASGSVSLSDIRDEYGPASGAVSLSDYYGHSSGLPSSGIITMDDFRGEQFDVLDIVTTTSSYSPRTNSCTYVHIFAVGAGGSGGSSEIDTSGLTTGVAASGGGAAGGVAHHRLATADFTGSYTIVVGTGGTGVTSAGDHFLAGNAGTATTVSGNSTTLTANGGGAGNADEDSSSGGDTSTAAASTGGTATGGNQNNYTGGAGGQAVGSGDQIGAATGGGAPAFSGSSYASSGVTNNTTTGALVSTKNDLPSVIATYLTNRNQGLTLTDLDGSDGVYSQASGGSGTPVYGAGSGGACHNTGRLSGDGGDGVVFIIYEVT